MNEELWDEIYALRKKLNNQAKRIERLEDIVLAMAMGSQSSGPDFGKHHTHSVYPAGGASELVKEIEEGKANEN